MRRIAILIAAVLATSAANAQPQMEISVDGLLGWETDFTLTPNETLSLGVGSFDIPPGIGYVALGILEGGPASLDISEISVYPPPMWVSVSW